VGTAPYDDIVRAFGDKILAADKTVDRKVLGSLVFGDGNRGNMKKLTCSLTFLVVVSAME